MLRKLAVLVLLVFPLACSGDDAVPTGPSRFPDIQGSFAGTMSRTELGGSTLACNVLLDIGVQSGPEWEGVVHVTDADELCGTRDIGAVSGTVNVLGQVTMTLENLAEGCSRFAGGRFEGNLNGSVLTVSSLVFCDGYATIELTGDRT